MVRELFQEARALTLPFGSFYQSFIVPRNQHPFFKEVASTDPSMQLNMCNEAVSELYLLANDVIFDPASKTEGMYMTHGKHFCRARIAENRFGAKRLLLLGSSDSCELSAETTARHHQQPLQPEEPPG